MKLVIASLDLETLSFRIYWSRIELQSMGECYGIMWKKGWISAISIPAARVLNKYFEAEAINF